MDTTTIAQAVPTLATIALPNHTGALRDYRCRHCGRLLFRAYLPAGTKIETVCWHGSCKTHNTVTASSGLQ